MSWWRTCLLTVPCVLALMAPARSESYAERLGWGPTDRVLIIHCDDVGMSLGSNLGAQATLKAGTVTSVSMMMPCPWVPGFVKSLRGKTPVDVGLHLTLTSEFDDYRTMPVAGKSQVPSLTDEMGCLWDNNRLLKEHATPDDVETEIRAQIDRAETMGIPITHLDSHMYALYAHEPFFERYLKVAVEKGLPLLIANGHLYHLTRERPDSTMHELFKKYAETVWNAGLPVIDDIHGGTYGWRSTDKKALYIEFLRTLKPGVTEMIVHPTVPDDVMPVITGGRTHLYGDYYALVSPQVMDVIREEGILLTTWRELKERRTNAGDIKP